LRFNPFISLLFILIASLSRPSNAQIPAQGGSAEGQFSPNSTAQIRPQAQKLFLEGLIAINDASLEEALALFLQAEELDPEQSGITHAIADAYFGLNDYDNALFYAEYSLTKEPMNPWFRITLAQILYAQGYYQSAVKEAELVLSQHPNQWIALTFLVRMHREMGFLADANTVIRERILHPIQRAATKYSPSRSQSNGFFIQPFSKAHKDWYKLLYRNFEVLEMRDSITAVVDEMHYLFPYDQEISTLASENNKKPVFSDNAGVTQASSSESTLTEPELSPLLQKLQQGSTPKSPEEAIEWLALLYQQNTSLTDQQKIALEWNQLFPEQGEILSELGRIALELDHPSAAKSWLEQAVRSPGQRSQKSEWYRQLGELQAQAENLDSAEQSFSYALRYDPENELGWASLAYFNARYRNNRAEAESNIGQALSINSKNANVIELQGDIYHILGESEQAIIWWEKALKLGGTTQRLQQKLSGKHE
jgi:tetratricopeptide (TPR) repeat protein